MGLPLPTLVRPPAPPMAWLTVRLDGPATPMLALLARAIGPVQTLLPLALNRAPALPTPLPLRVRDCPLTLRPPCSCRVAPLFTVVDEVPSVAALATIRAPARTVVAPV